MIRTFTPPLAGRRTAWPALLMLLAGCGAPSPPYNVVLISIDTLRADRIGAYGYDRDTSPALDALAARGVLYERAVAECSWTLPSHVTMLSGLYPSTHAVVKPALRIGSTTPLLAELLRAAGLATIALTDGGYVGAVHGFDRGFDVYDEREDTFAETVADAVQHLESLDIDERFFLFLHTYDVHCPYEPSAEHAAMFRSPDARYIETEGRCGNPHFNATVLRAGQAEHISDRYDGSVREMDDALAPLLDHLDVTGRLENTVVLVTSDHGEELGEHGRFGHERSLYRETLMVPFVVVAPGLTPARIADPVGLSDVTPTLLTVLGLELPEGIEGRPLLEPAPGGGWRPVALGERARYSELDRHVSMRSVMHTHHHLIRRTGNAHAELYSIFEDPLEARDVSAGASDVVAALGDSLEAYARARRARATETLPALPDEQLDRLRSLGYLN